LSVCIDVAAISLPSGTCHFCHFCHSLDSLDLGCFWKSHPRSAVYQLRTSGGPLPVELDYFFLPRAGFTGFRGCSRVHLKAVESSASRPIDASMLMSHCIARKAQAFGTVNSPLDLTNFFRPLATCDICDQGISKVFDFFSDVFEI